MIRNGPWKKTLSLLLSALVLAWGLIPQGVQHAHEGGIDLTHRHGACDEVAHHASHCRDSSEGHHEHATEFNVVSLRGSTTHLHWRLLGLEFSMPRPEAPTDGGEDRGMVPTTIVRTVHQLASGAWVGPLSDRALPLAAVPASLAVVDESTAAGVSATAATSIPLCDVARRELCGVLLA